MAKTLRLGLRTDQADRAHIVPFQQRLAEVIIQCVVVGQNQYMGVAAQFGDVPNWVVGAMNRGVVGRPVRKTFLPGVDPGDLPGQITHDTHQGMADVTRTKDHKAGIAAGLGLQQDRHATTTALSKAGTQREVRQLVAVFVVCQALAGAGDHPVFQVAAADGVVAVFPGDDHLTGRLPWYRACYAQYRDQNIGLTATFAVSNGLDPGQAFLHDGSPCAATQRSVAVTAWSTRSGVAGVSRGGL